MTTWSQIISLALKDSGVVGMGQTPNGQMMLDAQLRLNMMLDEWRADEFMVFQILDTAFITTGAATYSVGPSGDFNIAVRPDGVSFAYLRQVVPASPTPIDFPLQVLQSRDDYARIPLKNMQAAPCDAVWYDPGYPLGHVTLYPVPNPGGAWELHLLYPALLDKCADVTETIILPPRYERTIYKNLCVEFGSAFRIKPTDLMVREAAGLKKGIKRKNTRIPLAQMPEMLLAGRGYNILSDRP